MKKVLLLALFLMSLGLTGAWADELSEKQAQELAQSFVNSHFSRKGGSSRIKSSGQVSGLKSLGQVSGLYVFSMSEKGGFVIVSNDSRTTPILGYSDSGTFDPDKMPDNMRAWLQGYADEIAWLQKQGNAKSEPADKTTRAGTHDKADIEPLVSTKWNQEYPYNAFCYFNGEICATGCVATAMAQVMYYTEMKAGNNTTTTTDTIPAYTTSTDLLIPEIPAGSTINWDQMVTDYSSGNRYTDEQAIAVATLMLYCGCSIKTVYGPESGGLATDIPIALKKYFRN